MTSYRGRFRRPWWMIILIAAAGATTSSLQVYPHSLSYFNEVAGGPMNGSNHQINSSIDWGQNLFHVKRWYDAHPEARPFHLAYFGCVDPRRVGVEYDLPPKGPVSPADFVRPNPREIGPQPGWYAISVNFLHGMRFAISDGHGGTAFINDPWFVYFHQFQPVATAGYSIWIYHITPDECDRVRIEMGLPPLVPAVGAKRGTE